METLSKIKEIKVVLPQPKEVASVESFITKAIEANVPVETMEKLLAMRTQVKAEQAKEAFVTAMSQFQVNCPIIQKNKDVLNKDGKSVRYSFASLDSIVSQVKEILGECGLSYTTNVKNETGFVTAICKITHKLGHSEESSFMIPIDTEGYMSAPQKYASALTFAKRYAFCNALGILTGEDDVDAGDVGKRKEITGIMSIKGKITYLLGKLGLDVNKVDVITEIKNLTQLEVSDDEETLNEIKGRLEILVQEKQDANA